MRKQRSRVRPQRAGTLAVACVSVGLLDGCTVGPRYAPPDPPMAGAFKESSAAAYGATALNAWRPAEPQDTAIKGKWWEMFNEPELNTLEDELNIDNQNIAQYFENFMAARAQVAEARAGYFPTITGSPAVTNFGGGTTASATQGRVGSSGVSTGATFTLPVGATWTPDIWGAVRNSVREYQNAAQVSAAALQTMRLTEQTALATYYFQLRGQDSLQELYNRTIAVDREALELTRALFETGIDNQEDVAEAEVTLANAEALGAGAGVNRAIYEHAIATLIGKPASSFSLPVKPLATPVPAIPVAIPSKVLERRSDVAGAERTMAQLNAQIGVATAAFYPSITLTASGGLVSTSLSKLFALPALFWSLGASAAAVIFDGGLRAATVRQYTATYNADVAVYKQTVLTAFQQVEDGLSSLRILSQELARQQAAVVAAKKWVDIAMYRYKTGLDNYLTVVVAQTNQLTAEQTEVNVRVSEIVAAAQLIEALGGGWDVKQLPTASEVTSDEGLKKIQAPQ